MFLVILITAWAYTMYAQLCILHDIKQHIDTVLTAVRHAEYRVTLSDLFRQKGFKNCFSFKLHCFTRMFTAEDRVLWLSCANHFRRFVSSSVLNRDPRYLKLLYLVLLFPLMWYFSVFVLLKKRQSSNTRRMMLSAWLIFDWSEWRKEFSPSAYLGIISTLWS